MKKKFRELAKKEGFELVAFLAPRSYITVDFYKKWLERRFHGEMHYMARHLTAIEDTGKFFDGSVVVLAVNYFTFSLKKFLSRPERGLISKYAWGRDYHRVLKKKLKNILKEMDLSGRIYVDTGPILERELAYRGGFGWIGKNAMLINRKIGSYLFLSEIILKEMVEPDEEKLSPDLCYKCTRCIDACPTNAIIEPRLVDATKCIGYLTVEFKGTIPEELRARMGNWVFGCDVCQEVCPYNQKIKPTEIEDFYPRDRLFAPPLEELLQMERDDFQNLFRGTPVKRIGYEGFIRNVIVAAGNSGESHLKKYLEKLLSKGVEIWNDHILWALERL